ncbi:MAG TPA: MBL fold metallo-hydrolase, partial [Polyangiaceae bacterium]|nr:MBL fold metallo-hydrolase [Polyangiaceae bacterium]
QRLDGGAMFGNAPRALWTRWLAPDELGRVPLACRAFLVDDGEQRVLIETGIGAFFEPSLRERYGVVEDRHVLLESLASLGVDANDVDWVVLSHLHFDHAGGLLAPYRAGEPPRLAFPKARIVTSRVAFERAEHPHARDRASFIPELPALLKSSGRLELVERGEELTQLLGSRFEASITQGHTVGMLHTWVAGAHGSAFFCADLVPGSAWVHLPVTMGYDRFPELLIDEKAALFELIRGRGAHCLFTHDSSFAAARLERDGKGRYTVTGAVPEFRDWDLDASTAPTGTA